MTRPPPGTLRLYLIHVPGTPRPILDFLLDAAARAARRGLCAAGDGHRALN